jgi:hypothetical protein
LHGRTVGLGLGFAVAPHVLTRVRCVIVLLQHGVMLHGGSTICINKIKQPAAAEMPHSTYWQ